MITGVDHVTILVKDLDAAVAQYKTILGMDRVQRGEPRADQGFTAAVFDFGATSIELITPTNNYGPWARRLAAAGDGLYLVALKVDNDRETVEELRGKGIRLVDDPGPGTGPITKRVLVHPTAACGVMLSLFPGRGR